MFLCALLLSAGCSRYLPPTSSDSVDPECAPQSIGGEPNTRYPEPVAPDDDGEAAHYVGEFESAYVYNSLKASGVDHVSVRLDRTEILDETGNGHAILVETVATYRDGDAYVEAPYSAVYRVDETAMVRAETETDLANGSGTPYRVCD